MRSKEPVASPPSEEAWTRPDAYIGALARRRSFRRARDDRKRTQPETPRMLLSTVPLLGVAIMVIAFPGSQPQPEPREVAAKQQGVAQRGWFEEAQKEMHH
jgi:hypothetical protein